MTPSQGAPGTPPEHAGLHQQAAEVAADLLPEPEYLFRRFVDDTTTQETMTETDEVEDSSIHDILDGYHSEDNIDIDDDQ